MATISLPRIIGYKNVCDISREYMPFRTNAVKNLIVKNGGRAIAVIHPLYCHPFVLKHAKFRDPALQKAMIPTRYYPYLRRLVERVSKEKSVVFLFTNNEALTRRWALKINSNATFISIETENKNPFPSFPKKRKWETLGKTLIDLGISSLAIAGEMAYSRLDEKTGCVNYAFDQLSMYFDAKAITSLTFPNIYSHCQSVRLKED